MDNEKLNLNDKAFSVLKSQCGVLPKFVAFVDGDQVEQGGIFANVAINASELKSQRGPQAQLDIFDTTLNSKVIS